MAHNQLDAADDNEVFRITQDLIRIDTTNYGDGNAVGEAKAADYVAGLLAEVGLEPRFYEAVPGRTNVVTRWRGKDPKLPALLLHGHLDVVPADAADWSIDPFSGEIKDGFLWGRGAVDMKNMDAMILASVRDMIRRGEQPKRDVVLAFFADEEDNSRVGAEWMVAHHPEVFDGVEMAITEGLGSSEINGRTVFLVNTGEKGILWLRLNATGTAGHGSRVHEDNAILTLANAISRLGDADWPVTLTPTTESLVQRLRKITGAAQDADALEVARMASPTNALAGIFRNVANVTMLSSGYKSNVIPGHASAVIDVRDLPGQREQVIARLREILGSSIDIEVLSDVAPMESKPDSPLFAAINRSVLKYAPNAEVVPSIATGGTDNAFLTPLGIQGYGFAPLLLPADFNFAAMFHGVDERVPLDALVFGQKVLTDLLETY